MRPPQSVRRSKTFRAVAMASVAAGLFGVGIGLARRVEAPPVVPLFACWSTHLKTPLVPDNLAAGNDRDAIEAGDYFPINTFHLDRGLTAELLRSELERSIETPSEHRVVYLSAYATCDADGSILLMTQDFDPVTARGGLPIDDVLTLMDRDSRPTLLVLDLSWMLASGQAGLLPCGAGSQLVEHLKRRPGDQRLTLLSCSEGEAATTIAGAARTTFGYFFEAGLSGEADGFNPSAVTDASVSARELATYVADRVASWTRRHGPSRQTPLLISDSTTDFPIGGCRGSSPPVLSEPVTEYPQWLLEAWETHQSWQRSPVANSLPRLVRRYGVALLDIEKRWLAGFDQTSLREQLDASTRSIRQEFGETETLAAAQPVISMSQRLLNGAASPDDAVVEAWLLRIDSSSTAEAPAVTAAFAEAVADVPSESIVSAGLSALLRNEVGFRVALATVASELADRAPEVRYLEKEAVQRLALLVEEQPDLDGGLLRSFFETAVLREQAWCYSAAADWGSLRLDEAEASYRSAWAALSAPGYADTGDALELNATAGRLFRSVVWDQTLVQNASRACHEAFATLPDATPLLKSHPLLHADWIRASETAGRLRSLLAFDPKDAGQIDARIDAIEAASSELGQLITQLKQPLTREATGRLAESLRSGDLAGVAIAQTLLETPLLGAEQRAEICLAANEAARAVEGTLIAFTSDASRATVLSAVRGDNQRVSVESNKRSAEANAATEALRTASLLSLAGADAGAESLHRGLANQKGEALSGVDRLALVRSTISAAFESLDSETPLPIRSSACQILPAGRFSAVLDAHLASPTYLVESQRYQRWAQRAACRLRMQAENLSDSAILTEAARRLGGDTLPVLELDISRDAGRSLVLASLSERQPVARMKLHLRHDLTEPLVVGVMQPAGCLSVVTKVTPASAGSEVDLTMRLEPGATPADQASTEGVLLRVTQGIRTRHYRIATPGVAGVAPVQLFAEMAGVRQLVDDRLELPPQVAPTSLRLVAVNRTNRTLAFDAEIVAGGVYSTSVALGPLEEAPLQLTLAPAPKPEDGEASPPPVATVAESLAITLRDSTSGRILVDHKTDLGVADPGAYLRVRDARVGRDHDGHTVATLQLQRLPGSPEGVEVVWSLESSRPTASSAVAGGALAGKVTAQDPVATLRATLNPKEEVGALTATAEVNGVASAIRWTGRLPAHGQSAPLQVCGKPKINIEAAKLVASGDSLGYVVDVVSAAPGMHLEVGFADEGTPADRLDVCRRYERARRELVSIHLKPVAGDLVLSTTIEGWRGDLGTLGMAGRRILVAQVRDSNGVTVAQATQPVVIDADPADRLRVEPIDDALVAGTPVNLAVYTHDGLSGIDKVRLYVGEPINLLPPAEAAPVPATRESAGSERWVAAVPVPKGVTSVRVTAEVTNRVGLVRCLTQTLTVVSAEQASLGSVAGSVMEGTRPQPGLAVELRDADQQPIAAAKTNAGGEFVFEAVKPGKYLVWSVKSQSQRVGANAIEVKPGATSRADLKLSL